jgi:hypothetical protein
MFTAFGTRVPPRGLLTKSVLASNRYDQRMPVSVVAPPRF